DVSGDAGPRDLPSEGHASRGGAVAPSHIIECGKDSQAALIEVFLDDAFSARALRSVSGRAIFSTEKSGSERVVIHDTDLVLPAQWLERRFVVGTIVEIIMRLQCFIARQPVVAAHLKR